MTSCRTVLWRSRSVSTTPGMIELASASASKKMLTGPIPNRAGKRGQASLFCLVWSAPGAEGAFQAETRDRAPLPGFAAVGRAAVDAAAEREQFRFGLRLGDVPRPVAPCAALGLVRTTAEHRPVRRGPASTRAKACRVWPARPAADCVRHSAGPSANARPPESGRL